ncbi:hypothetical protein D3C86_1894520 [compost metagenome]
MVQILAQRALAATGLGDDRQQAAVLGRLAHGRADVADVLGQEDVFIAVHFLVEGVTRQAKVRLGLAGEPVFTQ